jgi:hypothetical protein
MYKVKSLVIILVALALMMVPSLSGISGQQANGSTNSQPGKNGIQDPHSEVKVEQAILLILIFH